MSQEEGNNLVSSKQAYGENKPKVDAVLKNWGDQMASEAGVTLVEPPVDIVAETHQMSRMDTPPALSGTTSSSVEKDKKTAPENHVNDDDLATPTDL